MSLKVKKKKKSSRIRGKASHGRGARKKGKGKGHKGGKGMAGTGKRAGQKITLVAKKYHGNYLGKKGITSKSTKKDKRKRINLRDIIMNLEKYGKKTKEGIEINLEDYKILGEGEVNRKLIIKTKEASKSAIEKVEKAGGKIIQNTEKKRN